MVPANSDRRLRPRPTQDTTIYYFITHTGLSPSMASLSSNFRFCLHRMSWSYNPNIAVTTLVWALPRSLATTYGITFVFSSSAYLDVSVQRVCPPIGVLCLQHSGLPHSEIYGSIHICDPRSFSQLITSFFASESLGIPHTPLFCLLYYS